MLRKRVAGWLICAAVVALVVPASAWADALFGTAGLRTGREAQEVSAALKILLGLTLLSLLPGILVAMTAFTRIIIVLSMLRQALGMQETPPNVVLIGLALFLTLFAMMPVATQVHDKALQPLLEDRVTVQAAAAAAAAPLRDFMLRQTREQDLALMVELARSVPPKSAEEVAFTSLVPAFMLSELKTAFQMGFVIFLPFLLVDLVVSSTLMSMGMLMVPPVVISLPIKVLMFVLIDGWTLVLRSLLGSFA